MLKMIVTGCGAIVAAGSASAAPVALSAVSDAPIVLVRQGCGLGFHRDFYGACAPNRVFYGAPIRRLPPPCPRFYHRDPDPARPVCYPNL